MKKIGSCYLKILLFTEISIIEQNKISNNLLLIGEFLEPEKFSEKNLNRNESVQ